MTAAFAGLLLSSCGKIQPNRDPEYWYDWWFEIDTNGSSRRNVHCSYSIMSRGNGTDGPSPDWLEVNDSDFVGGTIKILGTKDGKDTGFTKKISVTKKSGTFDFVVDEASTEVYIYGEATVYTTARDGERYEKTFQNYVVYTIK